MEIAPCSVSSSNECSSIASWQAADLRDEPRSRSATLRGCGDGRDRLCEMFFEHWQQKRPDLSEDDLCWQFERHASLAFSISRRWFGKRIAFDEETSIVLMRVWMFFGWYGFLDEVKPS